jgi:hypothetical protein
MGRRDDLRRGTWPAVAQCPFQSIMPASSMIVNVIRHDQRLPSGQALLGQPEDQQP